MNNNTSRPMETQVSAGYRAYVLGILILVYTFNFIDRQILGVLAIPIQEEFAVSDTQMGLMRGLAFALFYSVLGVPIAWLADRTNRVWIMTIALSLWSLMTAVSGLATNAVQLFLARLGVGVGEAGGVAPAYSIISDYFPPKQRARALAVYSFGIPIGSALGIIFAGIITTILDWRSAFFIVGIAGIALAPIFKLTTREPKRGQFDGPRHDMKPASFGDVLSKLKSKPSFWFLSIGAACASMMGYGMFAWMPTFVSRSFAEDLPAFFAWGQGWLVPDNAGDVLYAAYFYGAIVLVGGLIGLWLGGAFGDFLGQNRKSAYALVPAAAFFMAAPFFFVGVASNSLGLLFVLLLVPTALGLAWLGPVLSAFQHIVPPNMRATASAVFLLINNLIGIGIGDLAIGAMSDYFSATHGDEGLRYSILCGVSFYLLASVFLLIAARFLPRDWEAIEAPHLSSNEDVAPQGNAQSWAETSGRDIAYQSSDGLRLYARSWGEQTADQTVLCLHGLTRNHRDFVPMVNALGKHRRYVGWDARGRGQSQRDPNPDNYDIDIYASDAMRLVDELKLDKFAIVGTSMGGLTAMRLMSIIPERITGVVLNDVGPRLEQAGLDRIADYVGDTSNYPTFEAAALAAKSVHGPVFPDFDDQDWLAFAKRTMVQTEDGVVFDYDLRISDSLKAIRIDPETEAAGWSLFEAMKACPLLIVRGGNSDLLSAETTQRMVNQHGAAQAITVPNVGHAPILDEPLAVEHIERFLSSIADQKGPGK